MKRILIIGGNGSGKSFFAKELSKKLNLPLVHLDKLYWIGEWDVRPRSEFDELLEAELQKPEWIIDGTMNRTFPYRLGFCDTVFYFDFSTIACLYGAISRSIKNYGKVRDDMGGNCKEKLSPKFYRDVATYNSRNRKRYHALLDGTKNVEVIVFKNRGEVNRYLKDLEK